MNILGEVEDWFQHSHHRAEAPAPVMIKTTPGEHMSLAADLRTLADRVEPLADDVVARVQAVTANPEAADVFADVAHLAGLNLPAGVLTQAASGLKAVLGLIYPQPPQPGVEPSFTPAGPQVAGQAH